MTAIDQLIQNMYRDGHDIRGKHFFSRDLTVRDLRNLRQEDSQRVLPCANYFALASPIMPLAFIGLFFMLGRIDDVYQGPYERALAELKRSELTQALYVTTLRQKLLAEKRPQTLCASRPLEQMFSPGKELPEAAPVKKRKALTMMLDGKPSERLAGPMLLSKSQAEAGRLVRAKSAMQSQLDKLNHSDDYHTVSRVSARVDMIDRALKRMGC